MELTVGAGDAGCGGLEEVGLVQGGVVVVHTRQDDEECHRDAPGKQDDGSQGEDGASGSHDGDRSAQRLRWMRRRVSATVLQPTKSVQWLRVIPSSAGEAGTHTQWDDWLTRRARTLLLEDITPYVLQYRCFRCDEGAGKGGRAGFEECRISDVGAVVE